MRTSCERDRSGGYWAGPFTTTSEFEGGRHV